MKVVLIGLLVAASTSSIAFVPKTLVTIVSTSEVEKGVTALVGDNGKIHSLQCITRPEGYTTEKILLNHGPNPASISVPYDQKFYFSSVESAKHCAKLKSKLDSIPRDGSLTIIFYNDRVEQVITNY